MLKMKIMGGIALSALAVSGLYAEDTSMTDAGHKMLMETIEAHGGAKKWHDSGQLQFRWTYHLTDRGPKAIVDTLQTVDTSTLDAMHKVEGKDVSFGVSDGEYWIRPEDAETTPPHKFWTLTPFYFMGIPFVFNDENATATKLPDMMQFEGKEYAQVKITYNDKAGDSPDDYYVLLIDPETKVTRGAYYTVTNKLVAKDGVGPPKFITLDGLKEVDGIMLPHAHKTYSMEDGKITGQMRYTDVSDVKFLPKGTVDLSIPK